MFRAEDFIDEITKWIDSNLHKSLKIEDVAHRSGYSKWHLQRLFSQVKGEKIATYIREKKLSLAAKDLTEGNDKVIDISLRYGFDSQQSFTRSFSKRYNTPPQRYRQLHKKHF